METSLSLLDRLEDKPTDDDWRHLLDLHHLQNASVRSLSDEGSDLAQSGSSAAGILDTGPQEGTSRRDDSWPRRYSVRASGGLASM